MAIPEKDLRFKRVSVCAECNSCSTKTSCNPARKEFRNYDGIRLTSDGFDCALPVSIDSHSVYSYGCLYCFADNLISHRENSSLSIGQTSLNKLERIFAEEPSIFGDLIRRALKYDGRNKGGYPCPVQLGAITDACDNIERQQGWLLKFLDLAIKYKQPVRISTKGNLFLTDEYLDKISLAPHLFWVAFSIISPDDKVLSKIDLRAPNATMRLESMERLSKRGIKTSLRFRPILPGLSDSTKDYPHAWRTLIRKAAEAGANAVSYEVGFYPGGATKEVKKRWKTISSVADIPYKFIYKQFGKTQACTRPSYKWTENIMHAIHEEAHKLGLTVGVSDPTWKQLTDVGCCCGIKPDDPVFGNWERENATNAIVEARDKGKLIKFKDICPPWADEKDTLQRMVNTGVGPTAVYRQLHGTWEGKLRENWNDLHAERGPLKYFQGAMVPASRDENGDIIYKYNPLKRQNLKNIPYWKI